MAGRIKVYENGAPLNSEDTPALLKEPDEVSEYDQSCGTFGVGDYTRDSGKCPADAFICTEGDETPEQSLFGECMYALDCHMNYNMKSILANSDPIVTFIHQMIPHHQNAVNMAKALLKTNTLDASDEGDREMENMMWAIICVEINRCVGCTLGDDAAMLAPSSGDEPASPRHRAGVASMAWRTTRRFNTNAP